MLFYNIRDLFFSKSGDHKTFIIKITFLLCMIGIGGYLTGKGLGLLSEIAGRGQGGQQQESQPGQQQESQPTEVQKIAHDTLLKEILNIDHITEMHSQIVLAIMAALIIFASYQLKSPPAVYLISFVGVFISIEWMLKVIRHRSIFRKCYEELTTLESNLGIEALRSLPHPHKKLLSFDGFTLLIWLAILFLLFWIVLPLLVVSGRIQAVSTI
jgi:hypothetical protein